MGSSGIEQVEHVRRVVREDVSAPIVGGGCVLHFPPVRPGWAWDVLTVGVAVSPRAGFRAALYIDSPSIPEAIVGWVDQPAGSPGAAFDSAHPERVRDGERLAVEVSQAPSGGTARARVTYRLIELEEVAWPRAERTVVVNVNEAASAAQEG